MKTIIQLLKSCWRCYFWTLFYKINSVFSKKSGLNQQTRAIKLVVSLTSYPQRFDSVFLTIESLLTQTLQPDRIILWLSKQELKKPLPANLTSLKTRGLEIKTVAENIKSYKKLIYAIDEFGDCLLVTCDDDTLYTPSFLKGLYRSYQQYPHCISAYRCRTMFKVGGQFAPYEDWPFTINNRPSLQLFATGAGGVLYPPGALHPETTNKIFTELAPFADDIWFKAMSLLNKTKVVMVNKKSTHFPEIAKKASPTEHLWYTNQNKNDAQLKKVFDYYQLQNAIGECLETPKNKADSKLTAIKSMAKQVIWQSQKLTWRMRTLPDFIIIGAMKSGTSSLYVYLSQHPQILPARQKSVSFFDGGRNPAVDNFSKGEKWYRAHFPIKPSASISKTFEATPLYLFNPLTAERIFNTAPKTKLIVLLRNPTERAISHYFHSKRSGYETLPIMDALQMEQKRLAPLINNKNYQAQSFIQNSYQQRGIYHKHLQKFFDFFPQNQLLILNSEQFFTEPQKTLKQVCQFIGVDSNYQFKHERADNVANNKTPVSPEVVRYLDDYFAAHNQNLYKLIGKNFGW